MKLSRRQWFSKAGLLIPAAGLIRPTFAQTVLLNSFRFPVAGAAVAFDVAANSGGGLAAATSVITITVQNNSNRLLLIGGGVGDTSFATSGIISSITSNQGGTFTFITGTRIDAPGWVHWEMWALVAPAAAIHTVTVTFVGGTSLDQQWAGAISLYNVHQSATFGTAAAAGGTSTTPAPGAITIPANGMGVCGIASDSEGSLSFTTGTERTKTLGVGSDTSYAIGTHATAGSVSFAFSTASENWATSAIPVNPA